MVISWTDAAHTVILDLLKRDDGIIRLLELLAVSIASSSWHSKVRSARWEACIGNDGSPFAIINAASRAVAANQLVGLLWKRLHAMVTSLTA